MKLDGVLFQKYGVTDLPLKVQQCVSICQKGIEAIYSFTAENNLPSRKVMEKLA